MLPFHECGMWTPSELASSEVAWLVLFSIGGTFLPHSSSGAMTTAGAGVQASSVVGTGDTQARLPFLPLAGMA